LGLAIVREIAQRHGADVSLDDAGGGGLVVTIRFPS
jgi:signal transduction histidine kinase